MALTVLMTVVLIVSYGLMFGLVAFTENVITPDREPAAGSTAARASDTERPQ